MALDNERTPATNVQEKMDMKSPTQRMSADEMVDRFVHRINQADHDRRPAEELPEPLRIGIPDEHGQYGWRIMKCSDADRLSRYEAKLPGRLPPSLRSFAARYWYPAFEVGAIRLFANTGQDRPDEMTSAGFRDELLCKVLLRNGYLQFGRPAGGSYDPICFDIKARASDGECRIVRLNHEEVLCNEQTKILTEVATSFLCLIEDAR